jgi:hypothetical protein
MHCAIQGREFSSGIRNPKPLASSTWVAGPVLRAIS